MKNLKSMKSKKNMQNMLVVVIIMAMSVVIVACASAPDENVMPYRPAAKTEQPAVTATEAPAITEEPVSETEIHSYGILDDNYDDDAFRYAMVLDWINEDGSISWPEDWIDENGHVSVPEGWMLENYLNKDTTASGTEEPVQTDTAASGTKEPVQTDTVVSGTEEPVQTDTAASGTEEPVRTEAPKDNGKIEPEMNSVEGISRIIGLQANVETNYDKCVVYTLEADNPYDVIWDFGRIYDKYVEAADWSLVFDAEYYKNTFPALALLYHYDDELLLLHFQTVGVHEGRQGSKNFNVSVYIDNIDAAVHSAFGDEYAAYYFYYMLNFDSEKNVAVTGDAPKQLCIRMTAMQAQEFKCVNAYRTDEEGTGMYKGYPDYRGEVKLAPYIYDSELAAIACYRAYIDATGHWDGHDWAQANMNDYYELIDIVNAALLSENTIKGNNNIIRTPYSTFYKSEAHRNAMLSTEYVYFGASNCYIATDYVEYGAHKCVYFDMFTDELSTPMNP